jgi:hypothetical protein
VKRPHATGLRKREVCLRRFRERAGTQPTRYIDHDQSGRFSLSSGGSRVLFRSTRDSGIMTKMNVNTSSASMLATMQTRASRSKPGVPLAMIYRIGRCEKDRHLGRQVSHTFRNGKMLSDCPGRQPLRASEATLQRGRWRKPWVRGDRGGRSNCFAMKRALRPSIRLAPG